MVNRKPVPQTSNRDTQLAAALCLGPLDGWEVEPPLGCSVVLAEHRSGRAAVYRRQARRVWLHQPAESSDLGGVDPRSLTVRCVGLGELGNVSRSRFGGRA